MLSLRIRRAALVVVLVSASVLIPLSSLHAVPRERARKERPVKAPSTPSLFGRIVTVIWEAAGLRIDDNGVREDIRKDAGLRIDDNG